MSKTKRKPKSFDEKMCELADKVETHLSNASCVAQAILAEYETKLEEVQYERTVIAELLRDMIKGGIIHPVKSTHFVMLNRAQIIVEQTLRKERGTPTK
jgi:hypothetical protein